MRRFCSLDGAEIPYASIGKGYEAPNGQVVVLSEEEVDAAYGEKSREITMSRVIAIAEKPPRQAHDATYYVRPLPGGDQAYAILAAALEDSGQAVEVSFMLRQRRSPGVLYAEDGVLMLERAHYPERVNDIGFEPPALPANAAPMLAMAQALLAALPQGAGWAGEADQTAAALNAAVEAKLSGGKLPGAPAPAPVVTQAPDLMAALTESVKKAKAERGPGSKPARTRATRRAVA
jgi:DNA end-binding protein Ku